MKKIEKATEWFRVNGVDTTEVEGKLYVTITLSDGRRTDVQLSDSEIGFRSRQYDEEVSSKTLFETDYVIYDKAKWLYEKHGVWISVIPYNDEELSQILWENKIIHIKDDYNDCSDFTFYHSPTEAYEAAIEYTLKNLIK